MQATAVMASGDAGTRQNALYREVAQEYDAALKRLARGYERDPARREELLQDIHFALWRSLSQFDSRCSLRTWVYRVAHNVASTHVMHRRRGLGALLSLDEVAELAEPSNHVAAAEHRHDVERLLTLVDRLKPIDRQVILLYLEGFDAAEIVDVVGMSVVAITTRIHRVKQVLRQRFGNRRTRDD